MVPVALIVYILNALREGKLYPKLGDLANKMIAAVYILICVVVMIYLEREYWNLLFFRAGAYTTLDLIMGGLILGLFMEISRKLHFVLFVTNVVAIGYVLLGPYIPIDALWHPGISIERVISSASLEFDTGVLGDYPQLALTLIAAFLLVSAVASGFGAEGAMVKSFQRLFGKSNQTIPQMAVVSGAAVGMVSGSGSANVAVTGPFTIPLMKSYGLSPNYAGAISASAAMGGLIMPPMMAIAAFLMAEFLGVSYWEVVKRGFAVAAVYYGGLALSTYLLTTRNMPKMQVQPPKVANHDKFYTICFFAGIGLLIYFMGIAGMGAMLAAIYTSIIMLVAYLAVFIFYNYVRKLKLGNLWQSFRTIIETHAIMTSDLVILLGTLGIIVGLLTVSGFMIRVGMLLMAVGEVNVLLLILVGFIFGWIVGLGVPPSATYIIVAVVIAMPFTMWGIEPWVTHFFAFFLGVWSEFSPPTSLTAAVAARISGGNFMRIMFESLKMCSPLIILTFAIFVRTDIVILPTGLDQLRDTILLMVGCLGVTFLTFGKFSERLVIDIPLKMLIGVLSLVPLFHPNLTYSWIASGFVVGLLILGVILHTKLTAGKRVGAAV
jgi:TRAP transporter 4TM/12TM fusion protein